MIADGYVDYILGTSHQQYHWYLSLRHGTKDDSAFVSGYYTIPSQQSSRLTRVSQPISSGDTYQ